MTRGRAPYVAAWVGALWLLSALALAPCALLAAAETAWREGTSDLAARRNEWSQARLAYRDARWTRTLPDILAAFDREARAESTYLAALEAWVASGATAVRDDGTFRSLDELQDIYAAKEAELMARYEVRLLDQVGGVDGHR